jgi:hypothetical protein
MKTRLLKKIKKRYVYFWHNDHLYAWDKKKNEEVSKHMCTQYWMIRNACGPFTADKYLSRVIWRPLQR